MLTKEKIDQLVGLPVDLATKSCMDAGYDVEIYPKEAIIIQRMKPKTVLLFHSEGIVKGWKLDNPWDLYPLE